MKESIRVILKSYPFKDSLEVEGTAHLPCQAVQCLFPVLLPVTTIRSWREFVEAPCRPEKFMAKGILVKEPVQLGAKCALVFAHTAIF
jgi:hypothetical protein